MMAFLGTSTLKYLAIGIMVFSIIGGGLFLKNYIENSAIREFANQQQEQIIEDRNRQIENLTEQAERLDRIQRDIQQQTATNRRLFERGLQNVQTTPSSGEAPEAIQRALDAIRAGRTQ